MSVGFTHAIAQEGKMVDGALIPDMRGKWITICKGVETPNPNTEVAIRNCFASCPVCREKLKAMGEKLLCPCCDWDVVGLQPPEDCECVEDCENS